MTDTQDGRRTDTRDKIASLIDQGLTAREISLVLHISTQMVYRHIKRIRAERAS